MSSQALSGVVLLYPTAYVAVAWVLRWRNRRLSVAAFGALAVGVIGPIVLGLLSIGASVGLAEVGRRTLADLVGVPGIGMLAAGCLLCLPAFVGWVLPLRPRGSAADESVPD